ncbi:Oxysterol-binding protein-domain-containing protein [Sparassis latifolia]
MSRPHHTAGLPSVATAGPLDGDVVCAGWVLKKRRKKMQGFARRYFILHQSGLLSYSFEPGQQTRDQIQLKQAAISTSPGRKDIHIDSNNATFHIKCLSQPDFHMWIGAFRQFLREARETPTLGRRSPLARLHRTGQFNRRTEVLVEEMGNTINELHEAFAAWSGEDGSSRRVSSTRSKGEKDKKEHTNKDNHTVLGLFKKVSPHHHHEHRMKGTDTHAAAPSSAYQRIQDALDSLKYQHSALVRTLPSPIEPLASHVASLSSTAEEDRGTPTPTSTHGRKHLSAFSSVSDGSVWYDAPEGEGAEEFVFEATPGDEPESNTFDQESEYALRVEAESSSNTDVESVFDEVEATEPESTPPSESEEQVVRRTQLPSPPVTDEGSLFAVLKKNVGKDLSQVALPMSFNEPLTLLQKIAEESEYYDILTQAAQTDNPINRLCYVAAFAVSTYANTKFRTGRKGFNPMLAETFEDVRMKFIAEKVSHNPVILAYHAEGDNWELYATSSGRTKFWGKSLEIVPQGTIHLKIGSDHFQWKRPSSFVRNLMMGSKYLEHCGKMVIENVTNGARCVLDFKEGGYWGPTNIVAGTVHSASGRTEAHLEGKWDEQIAQTLDSSHLRVLWRTTPFPKNAPEYYGFTSFGITLNEVTSNLEGRLPPTDSRLRTDVRALEEGNLDLAEREKVRIEEMQRDRRRRGAERKPRWFRPEGDEWIYVGGYWEQRLQGWKDIERLW